MDFNPWSLRSSAAAASRRYHLPSDLYHGGGGGGEEILVEEELRPEFLCPFCAEDFDVIGLCCHMDEEHASEVKRGICPVCAKRVGMDLVGHITDQHASLLKVQRKRRVRKGGSTLNLSFLKKEMRDGNFQSLLMGSSNMLPSSSVEADPLLSSFVYNLPLVEEAPSSKPESSIEGSLAEGVIVEESSERNSHQSPLSAKDQEEMTRRCEFIQGLVMSTFLDDSL
ncbi:protein DEHYDRATION-INDUCED 19 homolog 4 isoform X2 [Impatiens glandulifera]|uniref:protein DEHYDRATION-INDUCED 19 homolog 4 isoform X2 n=1 Tax=Impatiens glandulifera TaxID=253017 RepID=UPI001FB061BE|nr:protein DEHYDRATION-INDUCED 19 homolog 4 isoform X2 [Impatiens glandulifera]